MARGSKSKGNKVLLLILGGGCLGLLVFACAISAVFAGAWLVYNESTPGKLAGTWKGRFEVGGRSDVLYTFRADGTFTEEAITPNGNRINSSDGRWNYRNGRVEIDCNNRTFEEATVRWIDKNTFDYHIVRHSQLGQIGLKTKFSRQ